MFSGRYELKYVMPTMKIARFSALIGEICHADPNTEAADAGYRVHSLYYDTKDFRFYYENVDGQKYRKKLRTRHYGAFEDSVPCFVEIKKKVNRGVFKKRLRMDRVPLLEASSWNAEAPSPSGGLDRVIIDEIDYLLRFYRLKPVVYTTYTRRAFFDPSFERLRITIDTELGGIAWEGGAEDYSGRKKLLEGHCVVEIKGRQKVPYWLSQLIWEFGMERVRMSKYCTAVRACL